MTQEKRLKDAKAAANEGDIRVFQTHNGGVMIPGVSLRCTPGYEPLAPLGHSTFQVALRLLFAVGAVYNFLRVKASMKLSGVMLMICRLICRAKRSMV